MENTKNNRFNQYGYQWADPFYYGRLKELAQRMRAVPTHAENLLWQSLRGKQLGEFKFRRQHIIGRYITDMVCLRQRLIVEIDGLIHQLPDNQQSDAERQTELEEMGFAVIRFTNEQITQDLPNVLCKIETTLQHLSGHS